LEAKTITLVGNEESIMPSPNHDSEIMQKLSPSARAVLQALCKLENGVQVERFQQGQDHALEDLKRWVSTYRGGFCKAIKKRVRQVLTRGGIAVITQDDIIGLIHDLWSNNISKLSRTELKVLEGTLRNPSDGIIGLAEKIGLTYARTRRAREHLQMTGILQRKGCFNVAPLGLDRILIRLENPTYIPVSPYFEKTLFVDHPRIVLVVGATPSGQRKILEQTIRSLRTVSDSVTIWRLSIGQPSFRDTYYDTHSKRFAFDPFHFRLSLADEDPIILGERPPSIVMFPTKLTKAETKIIDELVNNYDTTAQDIAKSTKLSESTTFRRRAKLLKDKIITARHHVNIPSLSDRVICSTSPDSAGRIMKAWIQYLPVTYVSRIENVESKGTEKRILLASALPKGSAQELIEVLESERSRVDDYEVFKVSASYQNILNVSRLYDTRKRDWKFDSTFFDLGSYGIYRRDAKSTNIPLDLA
jgi:DNA-binding Lrp family transcriptional regulator